MQYCLIFKDPNQDFVNFDVQFTNENPNLTPESTPTEGLEQKLFEDFDYTCPSQFSSTVIS